MEGYIYSTWDDNQMEDYLVSRGALKSGAEKTRDQHSKSTKENSAAVADLVQEAWSDSYFLSSQRIILANKTLTFVQRGWLVDKGMIKTD